MENFRIVFKIQFRGRRFDGRPVLHEKEYSYPDWDLRMSTKETSIHLLARLLLTETSMGGKRRARIIAELERNRMEFTVDVRGNPRYVRYPNRPLFEHFARFKNVCLSIEEKVMRVTAYFERL